MYRGSRKHVLDWVERPSFPRELVELIELPGVELPAAPIWTPSGYRRPVEARLEDWGPRAFGPHHVWDTLANWWLVHHKGANTPNWDIAMPLWIDGRMGLFLCEAKANVAELGEGEKTRSSGSAASEANHTQIGLAIAEARAGLAAYCPDITIDRDTHYQLSNRLAFAWKLASEGVPVILMYLGFIGDVGLDRQQHFATQSEWDAVMRAYLGGVGATDLLESKLAIRGTTVHLISRTRVVLEVSDPSGLVPYGIPKR
jgi:hypothetical protein